MIDRRHRAPAVDPTVAWSRRVRRVGGFIQAGFAAFWLIRGSLVIGDLAGVGLAALFSATVVAVVAYAVRVTAGVAPRPAGRDARSIERAVTLAIVIQLAASFAAPALAIATGHSDWVLPSIAITIGPLLLWLDHRVDIPRYRPVGWTLIIGPVVLAATMSGTALAATTGITAGVLLLGTAVAGFHDLSQLRLTAPGNAAVKPGTHRTHTPLRTRAPIRQAATSSNSPVRSSPFATQEMP